MLAPVCVSKEKLVARRARPLLVVVSDGTIASGVEVDGVQAEAEVKSVSIVRRIGCRRSRGDRDKFQEQFVKL